VKEPEEREQRATRAWLRIDLLIAICALLISALTAAASLYQTRVIANQIENDGLGPTVARTVGQVAGS